MTTRSAGSQSPNRAPVDHYSLPSLHNGKREVPLGNVDLPAPASMAQTVDSKVHSTWRLGSLDAPEKGRLPVAFAAGSVNLTTASSPPK